MEGRNKALINNCFFIFGT